MIGGMKRLVDEVFEIGSYFCKIRGMMTTPTVCSQDGQMTDEQRIALLLQAEDFRMREVHKPSYIHKGTLKEIEFEMSRGKETFLGMFLAYFRQTEPK